MHATSSVLALYPSPELDRLYKACALDWPVDDLGLESLGGFLGNRINRLSKALRDAFRFTTTWNFAKPDPLSLNHVRNALRRTTYPELETFEVYVPAGFKGNLYDYVKEHADVQVIPQIGVYTKLLPAANKYFAEFVEDASTYSSAVFPTLSLLYSEFTAETLAELLKKESKWLVAGNRNDILLFQSVYASLNECLDTMTLVNSINQNVYVQASSKDVARQVRMLSDTAGQTISALQRQKTAVASNALKELAVTIELVARWVEYYSAIHVRQIALTTALRLTEDKLIKSL